MLASLLESSISFRKPVMAAESRYPAQCAEFAGMDFTAYCNHAINKVLRC